MKQWVLVLVLGLAVGASLDLSAETEGDALVQQVTELLRQREGHEPSQRAVVRALNARTDSLINAGKYQEAETVARAALNLSTRVLGVAHLDTLTSVNKLAKLYQDQGRYEDAEPLIRQALLGMDQMESAKHSDTRARSDYNLAAMYWEAGREAEARSLIRQALPADEPVLGLDHSDTEEGTLVRQVIEKMLQRGGDEPTQQDVVGTLNGRTVSLGKAGKYPVAEKIARVALGLGTHALGAEHPDTLTSVNNLAWVLAAQGRDAEAEPFYRRVRESKQPEREVARSNSPQSADKPPDITDQALIDATRAMLREHTGAEPDTATLAHFLKDAGEELYRRGNYAAAERTLRIATDLVRQEIAAEQSVAQNKHRDLLASVDDFANMDEHALIDAVTAKLRERDGVEPDAGVLGAALGGIAVELLVHGRTAESERIGRIAVERLTREVETARSDAIASGKVVDALRADAFESIENLANINDQAVIAAVTAKLRKQSDAEPDAAALVDALNRIAVGLHQQGRYPEAERIAHIALARGEQVLGPEDPRTLAAINNLGDLDQAQGRFGEAEPLLRRALAARERVLGAEHPDTLLSVNNLASLYDSQGRAAEAEPLYRRALEANERVLGAEHPNTLTSLSNLGHLYQTQRRYNDAEPLFRRSLEASERELGAEDPRTITIVNNLASLYEAQGRYGDAEPLYRRVAEVSVRVLGPGHPDTVAYLNNLANLYKAQGRYGEAEPLYSQALEARERVLGAEHPQTLASINNLADIYVHQGRLVRAESLYRRLLEACERQLGSEHPLTLTIVSNVAALYQAQGRYGEAEPLCRRALEVRERLLGAEHPDTLSSVNNLASLYETQGRYADAEPLFRRVLETNERVLGSEHQNTLNSVNNLAGLYHSQGRYREAEPLFRRALEAHKRLLGAEHPDTLISVNNLATLYTADGRYEEAEPLFREVLEVRERLLGAGHPETLGSVNNLASLYDTQGRYGEAEPLCRRVLDVRERLLGTEHPDTLGSVNNLAALYARQNRYGEAEPLFRRALETNERVLGAEHPDTLQSVSNLASIYHSQGRYVEAEPLDRRALEASERVLGAEHPATLERVNSLAALYTSQGHYEEAEPLLRLALETRERVLGAGHPETLASVNNLAALYQSQGRNAEAEPLFRRALGGFERVLGAAHPNTIEAQLNLAVTLVNLNRPGGALEQLHTLDGRLRTFVARQLDSTGSERVRRQWLATESRLQDLVFTLALAHPDGPALPLAADILLRWKRLAAEEESAIARLARTGEDPRIRDLAGGLRAARSDLSRLVNLPKVDPKEVAARLADFERLETALATASRPFRSQLAGRSVEWQSVRAALPRGSALLELRAFAPTDFKTNHSSEPHWLALVIPADPGDGPDLRLTDLGPVAGSVPVLGRLLVGDADAAGPLYSALFGALDPIVAGYPTLFIAPDNALDLVAFAQLKLPDGRYWVQRQALREVRTGRDLVVPAPEHEPVGMLAMGGADYDRFPAVGTAAHAEKQTSKNKSKAAAKSGTHQAKSPKATEPEPPTSASAPPPPSPSLLLAMNERLRSDRGSFDPLAHTGPEVRAVARYYWDPEGHKALVLDGKRPGTEPAEGWLKALTEPPRVLHLATHGFFLPAPKDEPTDPTTAAERPMTLGGVALAGANLGLKGQRGPDGQDGILYALEAADLNLEGTELVTLSACDTGKGEVDRSEGVYGLVRAFQIAGARDVMMTLWPLNDPLAQAFMDDFYRHWFDARKHLTPAEALRTTQLDWIGDQDERRRDPRYWAPYVLIERGTGQGGGSPNRGRRDTDPALAPVPSSATEKAIMTAGKAIGG